MKKQIMIALMATTLGISMLAGCGKSDEQKARDEIMSHMSDDEKAAIAEDQKAMAEYEAEKEKEENKEPVDLMEILEEKSLIEFVNNVNENAISYVNVPNIYILLPGDEHITSSEFGRIVYDSCLGIQPYAKESKYMTGESIDLGNYKISIVTESVWGQICLRRNSEENILIIKAEGEQAVEFLEKNFDFIKEQLESLADVKDADPEILGKYTGDNGNTVKIGNGDDGFFISITGFNSYDGTLTWLEDNLYESKSDDVWVQVQLTEEGIAIKSSYLLLEGSYARD